MRCEHCHAEKLVAFSCKKRDFCPSCGARRMAETAALLADEVLPECPLRQWVLSLPHADLAKPPTPRHVAMSWARRLQRVFGIEIDRCARCGGTLKIIARIEEPQVIARILSHLQRPAPQQYRAELPLGARAPPVQSRLL